MPVWLEVRLHEERRGVVRLLEAALECSVYFAPTDHVLTLPELVEFGRKLGLQPGEMQDALPYIRADQDADYRLIPRGTSVVPWMVESRPIDPDYRNPRAFDFLDDQLRSAVRAVGALKAGSERTMVVERAVAAGLSAHDVEVAIAIGVLSGHLVDRSGILSYAVGREVWPPPRERRKPTSAYNGLPDRSEARKRAYPIVRDVIARRSDGRSLATEPLDAFGEKLDALGHGHLRLWWQQMVGELRRGDVQLTPVSVTVLAAALVEGALTFVVQHARSKDQPMFGSRDFAEPPTRWRMEQLVASAARGGSAAILDEGSRKRAEWLNAARQRIHAGRLLSSHPGGVPDYRPEDAHEARAVADLVVRRVLDWVEELG